MQLTLGKIAFFFFLTTVTACGFIDLKHRRIPHLVTIPLILAGLVYHAVFSSTELSLTAAASAVVFFMLSYLAWKYGQIGGGDVFLLTALASWLGWKVTLVVLFNACLVGMPYGIMKLIRAGELRSRFSALFYGLHMRLHGIKADGMFERLPEDPMAPVPAGATPFGTFLTLGLWVCFILYISIRGI